MLCWILRVEKWKCEIPIIEPYCIWERFLTRVDLKWPDLNPLILGHVFKLSIFLFYHSAWEMCLVRDLELFISPFLNIIIFNQKMIMCIIIWKGNLASVLFNILQKIKM